MNMRTIGIKKVSAPTFNNNGRGQQNNSKDRDFQKFLDKCRCEGVCPVSIDGGAKDMSRVKIILDLSGSISCSIFDNEYVSPRQGETFRAYNNKGELV